MAVPAVRGEHVLEERGADPAGSAVLRSQVVCAVLGLVIEKPSHGYEIGQRFERRFGGFLSVGRSSIYAALASLMEAALIEKMSGRSTTGVSRGARRGRPTGPRREARVRTGVGWRSAFATTLSGSRCWGG